MRKMKLDVGTLRAHDDSEYTDACPPSHWRDCRTEAC